MILSTPEAWSTQVTYESLIRHFHHKNSPIETLAAGRTKCSKPKNHEDAEESDENETLTVFVGKIRVKHRHGKSDESASDCFSHIDGWACQPYMILMMDSTRRQNSGCDAAAARLLAGLIEEMAVGDK